MNAVTISSGGSMAAPSRGERAAPLYRFAMRFIRRAVYRRFRRESLRSLRQMPDYVRTDIGVPEHAIGDVASGLAQRRTEAWMQEVVGRRAAIAAD